MKIIRVVVAMLVLGLSALVFASGTAGAGDGVPRTANSIGAGTPHFLASGTAGAGDGVPRAG